jgi:Protein of unknown function (DUF3341)
MNRRAPALYGLMAEFASAEALLVAARRTYAEGYRETEAYSPFPVEGLSEAIGFTSNRVPLLTLLGGILGAAIGYFIQWYSAVIDYPLNVGGRPLNSWPAFILVTFELAILGAALAAVFGMLLLNGLPRLSHPVFNARDFDLATRDRFFLGIKVNDPLFDREATRRFLESLRPLNVAEVGN